MCRIFGFRSVIHSQVHQSLVQAENALSNQSERHPDGWGVAYYVGESPHIIKGEQKAMEDSIFKKVSGVVASQTVLAHIRKATHGDINILNSHPFQYGRWTFCHNGNVKDFGQYRDQVMSRIDPELRRFILGETDSETLFYFILTHLKQDLNLNDPSLKASDVNERTKFALREFIDIVGPCNFENPNLFSDTFLTFIITNGQLMLAHNGGQRLRYSTHKTKCVDRDSCAFFAPVCEAPSTNGFVNHLIISSEDLSGDNIWTDMAPHEIIGVDKNMSLFKDFLY
ncbi:MAG: class II glutamine amidotransferase [Bdellovibrionales bacterium]